MRIATIDIGSNTVLLLISEFLKEKLVLKTLFNQYEVPRLSKNLNSSGNISKEGIKNLLEILEEYVNKAREYECKKVLAYATNAMRIANNREEIIRLVKNALELEVKIISGAEEAKFSYLGAISSAGNANNLVIDIGGGSTEIILGEANSILFRKSFPVGAVHLTESFILKRPIDNSTKELMVEKIRETFSELEDIPLNSPNIIAVAGTPTSIAAIELGLDYYDELRIENYRIQLSELEKFIEQIQQLRPEALLNKYPNLLKGRADVLFAGSLILFELIKLFNGKEASVSGRGLRYGMALDFFRSYFNVPSFKNITIV